MHEIPLKRSVTAPHTPVPHSSFSVPSITVTANALGSFTPGGLSRHRSASPYLQSHLHSSDSPRPLGLLSHKDVVLGRSRSRSPTPTPQQSESRTPGSTSSASSIPIPSSEKSSNMLSRIYASTDSSGLLSSNTPSTAVSKAEQLPEVHPPDYNSNMSSQSNLSMYAPNESSAIFEMDRRSSGDSRLTTLTTSKDLNFPGSERSEKGNKISRSVRRKFPGYVAAEVQRISRSDPGANTPHFQFPIWRESAAPDLSIRPEDFERKLIGDPDPSFHRSLNSPVRDCLDQVVLEQVGSFRVHHLRNDSLGELPHISTVEELTPSPPPLPSGAHSPRKESYIPSSSEASLNNGTPPSRPEINTLQLVTVPSAVGESGEITTSTVFLPGEYGRRQHSRAGARSHGSRNISVPLQIPTQTELQTEGITGTRVTPEGPPATPESPFTSISREQTRLKGAAHNPPSPLITFLSVMRSKVDDGSRKPVPPGKGNPDWILPAQPLRVTAAVCFAHAYGSVLHALQLDLRSAHGGRPSSLGSMVVDNENVLSAVPSHVTSAQIPSPLGSSIADNQDPMTTLPPHIAEHMRVESPSLRSMQRIIEGHGRRFLSNQ